MVTMIKMTINELLPHPRRINIIENNFKLTSGKQILIKSPQDEYLTKSVQSFVSFLSDSFGIHWKSTTNSQISEDSIGLDLRIQPELVGKLQGYRLTIHPEKITIVGNEASGVYYGLCTLRRILKNPGFHLQNQIQCLDIFDWPDFPARGVMLDISRDKVPTIETLHRIIDILSSLKINQFQLYTEHTFAYQQHAVVWQNSSPITGDEIRSLDQYCRERFIELVPNQNSFGHMHRWLQYPQYEPLGELYGVESPQWWGKGSFSLCPVNPESFKLIQSLYDELLPNFSSSLVNIGCDETFDLGMGQSKQAVDKLGKGQVYLDFLKRLYVDLTSRGRTIQFWGDIVLEHPELVYQLPNDLIALEWGYEANHPFESRTQKFADAGVPFYVCPGTSAWNSIAGRTNNAVGNLSNAALMGLKNNAIGYLITDWGDNGHWQALPISYLGYAYGAAVSWCYEANKSLSLPHVMDQYIFEDIKGGMGSAAYDLGNIYQLFDQKLENASILFKIMQTPLKELEKYKNLMDISYFGQVEEAMEKAAEPLIQSDPGSDDGWMLKREFLLTKQLLLHSSKRGRFALKPNEDDRKALLKEIDYLINEYNEIWHFRNRPGGFSDSINRFKVAREDYLP